MSNNKHTKVQISIYAAKLKNVAGAFKGRSIDEERSRGKSLSLNSERLLTKTRCFSYFVSNRNIRSLCDRDTVGGRRHGTTSNFRQDGSVSYKRDLATSRHHQKDQIFSLTRKLFLVLYESYMHHHHHSVGDTFADILVSRIPSIPPGPLPLPPHIPLGPKPNSISVSLMKSRGKRTPS
jgi:hypothetical protein